MSRIILIGGTPRCGKTTLAQKISKELGIPWLSTDALESIAHNYTLKDKEDILFPKSLLRKKTNYSNDEMYGTFSADEIVDSYIKQADTTSQAVETLVDYASKEGWGYVIEGYHVTPKLLKKLKENNLTFSSVILVNTNSSDAIKRSLTSEVKNDWLRDKTKNPDTYPKIGAMIDLYSHKLIQEAKGSDIEVIDMANSFEDKFKQVFESLIK